MLRRRILSREAPVGIVGQGYVGLSLACAAADAGFPVVGIDLDDERIAALQAGELVVAGVDPALFAQGLASQRLAFATDAALIADAQILLVCVPTPLRDHAPDLSHVKHASRTIAARLAPGSLVVLESTTYPGTTEQVVLPLLEGSGLVMGRDFLLAYSPERMDPGNREYGLRNTPKIVGGVTPEATGLATAFYGQLVDKVVAISSARAAELAKLLENTFRHVNIALVNELAMICHETGVDVWEVVDAAATKPFGFMPFQPGPGVGGHCIPLDPTYLGWQVRRDVGRPFRVLEQAEDVNAQTPAWVASRIGEALNDHGKAVKGANVLVLGVAYKPDVGDIRESPSIKVMQQLHRRGAQLRFNDPLVGAIELRERAIRSVELTREAVERADCVALLTPHSRYDLDWLADHAPLVFDARNAFGHDRRPNVVRL